MSYPTGKLPHCSPNACAEIRRILLCAPNVLVKACVFSNWDRPLCPQRLCRNSAHFALCAQRIGEAVCFFQSGCHMLPPGNSLVHHFEEYCKPGWIRTRGVNQDKRRKSFLFSLSAKYTHSLVVLKIFVQYYAMFLVEWLVSWEYFVYIVSSETKNNRTLL